MECRSIYVEPMPDKEAVAAMYGTDYDQFISESASHSGDAGARNVLNALATRKKGVFLDFGCGGGHLLQEIASSGWATYGIEFADDNSERARELRIVSSLDRIPSETEFDVVHFGDVVEHLPDAGSQMAAVMSRLKSNGFVIVQGPLEANFNLFLLAIRISKLLRRNTSTMPPYHVFMATAQGQEQFFVELGLQTEQFDIFESAHPAPVAITFSDLSNLRVLSLFILRKLSQTLSPVLDRRSGNRFFYMGRKGHGICRESSINKSGK